jgi:spore coat polysaccharide biosynthesis protein SpsF (cytidylyltransferase family)
MSSDAVILLQARMGSTRLPGKVFAPVMGKSVLTHCLERLIASGAGTVVLATTTELEDDVLPAEAERLGVAVVRGDRLDVLARFAIAARTLTPRFVVRATADNPAVDIGAPVRTLQALRSSGADFCCETGLPIGTAVEAMTIEALLDAHLRATAPADREHVTTFIRRERSRYRVVETPAPSSVCRPDLRLTVDTTGDLTFIRAIAARLQTPLSHAPLERIIAAADELRAQESIA